MVGMVLLSSLTAQAASYIAVVDVPVVRTRSAWLTGYEAMAPRRTLVDFGAQVRIVPSRPGERVVARAPLGIAVTGRVQRTRWVNEADDPYFTTTARIEIDAFWMHWFEGDSWVPYVSTGVGPGVASFRGWLNPGAHSEVIVGVAGIQKPGVHPLILQGRVGGLYHPWAYTMFDAGPTTSWSPSEIVGSIEIGWLGPIQR